MAAPPPPPNPSQGRAAPPPPPVANAAPTPFPVPNQNAPAFPASGKNAPPVPNMEPFGNARTLIDLRKGILFLQCMCVWVVLWCSLLYKVIRIKNHIYGLVIRQHGMPSQSFNIFCPRYGSGFKAASSCQSSHYRAQARRSASAKRPLEDCHHRPIELQRFVLVQCQRQDASAAPL